MQDTTLERTSDREIVITRSFRAPPRIVFEAFTKSEHVRKWWAPRSRGVELVACDADVSVGGAYRYVMRVRDLGDMAFSGRYVELTPPSRLVYTQVFEPMKDAGEAVVTVTFDAEPGERTKMTSRERYPSKDALEAAIQSGMEGGMRESMDQLDVLVAAIFAG
jgi:uncharacterized protein YndB with AHSA1/START domain